MREIKFRAWNKENKIMVYKNEDGSSCYWDGVLASSVELINCELNGEINRSEYEFMQYTGLKDKNGVEIYEGDILEDSYSDDRAIVEWSEEDGMFVLIIDDVQTNFSNEKSTDWEVMGNIYDN